MANFLNRLAARALGVLPLAEPAIPARFSSDTPSNAFLGAEPAIQPSYPSAQTFPETSEGRPDPLARSETNASLETRVARPSSPFLDEARHLPRSPQPSAIPRQAPMYPPYAESETVPPSPERDEIVKRHLVAALNPTSETVEGPAVYKPRVSSPALVPFVEPSPVPRLTPLAEPTRRAVVPHSERLQAFHPLPPTVSVSIGRIEIRAEITSPSPAAPVQRPRTSVLSLDQFLKQVDGSPR